MWQLINLQADAKTMLPLLTEMMKDEDAAFRQNVMWNLYRYGEEALPLYLEGLKDKEVNVRSAAVQSMQRLGAKAKKAMPELIELAKRDANASIRWQAAYALAQLGEESLPTLVELLADKDANVRLNAMHAMQRFAGKAKAAVAPLIKILKEESNNSLRWTAAQTLGAIGTEAKDAIPALKEATQDKDQNVRSFAQQALKQIERK
jgi:HEAT repeat protein